MNIFRSAGVAVGIIIGLIICVVLFRIANTNHKTITEYDERQNAVRGKAYKYAFYAVLIFEVVLLILEIGQIPVPAESYVLHFGSVILGCTVLAAYCIWNGAYWGLNNNPRRYLAVLIVTGIINAIPVAGSVKSGEIMVNGKLAAPGINLLVLIMMGVMALVFLVRCLFDRGAGEEDDA